jgi:hypothetical protein
MITKKIYVGIYDWTIYYTEIEKGDKSKLTIKRLQKIYPKEIKKKDKELFYEIKSNIKHERKDGGLCSCFEYSRKTSVLIYRTTKKKERLRVIAHELRHATDQILDVKNICDIEASAYLQGYIFMKLFNI